MPLEESLPPLSIDKEMLTPVVQRLLSQEGAEVIDFQSKAVTGGFEAATAIYLVKGKAQVASGTVPWRVVLKVIHLVAGNEDPQGFLYWQREVLAYSSGLLYTLPCKLTAPRCHLITEQPGGETWLWLEYVDDTVGKSWPLEHYGIVAQQLGAFNGSYLTGCQIPSQPWIPRAWLRAYVEHAAPAVQFILENPDHPLVKSLFPGDVLGAALKIWEEREHFFSILGSLPEVFCHQDAFKGNLFTAHDQLVGIDWSYMGPAVLGAEIVPLVGASMVFSGFPAKQAMQLDQVVFDGYLAGLKDVGCHVNPQEVRLAYCLTFILRYGIGGQIGQVIPWLLDEITVHQLEIKSGTTADEYSQSSSSMSDYFLTVLMEGMKLVGFDPFSGPS